jgi:ribonuclease HII
MTFVLGTDEAGYGPNLGPLCIAACAWEAPNASAADNLYDCLANFITAEGADDGKLAIADSKRLYKPGGTLGQLERGVLTALAAMDKLPRCWRDIWRALDGGDALSQIDALAWHDAYDEPLPRDVLLAEVTALAQTFCNGCQSAAVRIVALQSAVLFPAAFNKAVKRAGNKAEVLSLTTLELARRVLEMLPAGRAVVLCDKHGGRSYYAGLLQHIFAEELVIVRHESADLGVYDVRHAGRAIEFRFQPKGERHLPTALASMTAKYLRELAMRPFNDFWQKHVPDLKPTAGYPTDAGRFYDAISKARRRLKIADHVLWRDR